MTMLNSSAKNRPVREPLQAIYQTRAEQAEHKRPEMQLCLKSTPEPPLTTASMLYTPIQSLLG